MQLYRELGPAAATAVVIGNIVGIGIFTTSGLIATETGHSVWLIGIWVLGGALALIGALCYARLGMEIPRSGGEYAFLYSHYGALPAFLAGWASLIIGFSAPIAASALALAHYLQPVFPGHGLDGLLPERVIALGAVVIVSLLLSTGLRSGVGIHVAVTAVNLVLSVGFAIVVFLRADLSLNLQNNLFGGGTAAGLTGLSSAIILVMFTYSGWNAAAYIGEEIRNPRRNIPLALISGTLAVTVLYCLINVAYFGAVPLSLLAGRVAVAGVVGSSLFGATGNLFVNLLVAISILSSLTAMSIAGPRVYFAMARDGLFPRWLQKVSSRRKIPLRALWFQVGFAGLLILIGTFRQILLFSGFILLFFATLAVSVLLRRGSERRPPIYRLLSGAFVLINTVVLASAVVSHPGEALAGFVTILAGLPLYWYFRRQTGVGC